MSRLGTDWVVEHRSGRAVELHSLPGPDEPRRAVRILSVSAPALVLGSTQSADLVDAARARQAGVELVHRRSGGGAVLLVPGEHVWVDLFIAKGDVLWDDDVVAAAGWVGDAWRATAAANGVSEPWVHSGGLVDSPWSRLVCFAGRGPGEVFTGDRKLVGVSQRRTRDRLRVQTALHRRWNARRTLDLLDLAEADRRAGERELAGSVASIDVEIDVVVESLLTHLPV